MYPTQDFTTLRLAGCDLIEKVGFNAKFNPFSAAILPLNETLVVYLAWTERKYIFRFCGWKNNFGSLGQHLTHLSFHLSPLIQTHFGTYVGR